MKVSRARCAISGRLGLSLALRGWWLACVRVSLVGTDAGDTRHGRGLAGRKEDRSGVWACEIDAVWAA
jgi:hypothetical protein